MNNQINMQSTGFEEYEIFNNPVLDAFRPNRSTILHEAPAGSGKTAFLCEKSIQLANAGQRVLIVQPTLDLISETIAKIQKIDLLVSVSRIDATNTNKNIVRTVVDHLKQSDREGQILLITHASFERLPYVHNKTDWCLFMDEPLQSHRAVSIEHDHTHMPLTSRLKTVPVDEKWSKIEFIGKAEVVQFKEMMKTDNGLRLLSEACDLLSSPKWDVFVHTSSYERFIDDSIRKAPAPFIYGVLKSNICEGYKSVRIAGAHLSESLLIKSWTIQGCQLKYEEIPNLRCKAHTDCARVKIYYGIEDDWSKTIRDDHKDIFWNRFIQKISEMAGSNGFAFSANNDVADIFRDDEKAIKLPNVPHGLNNYRHINFIAYLSATNPRPQHGSFLKWYGLTEDEIRRDFYYSKAYQGIMRGGIRNPDGTEPQTVVVPDLGLALWLQEIFEGSEIEWLGFSLPKKERKRPGPKRIHSNNAGKMREYRKRLSTNEHVELLKHQISLFSQIHENAEFKCSKTCYEFDIYKIEYVMRFRACIWDNIYCKFPRYYVVSEATESFIDKLKQYHSHRYKTKKSNKLMSVGFPCPDNDSMRKKDNIYIANGILLDNDKGDLSPTEFSELLPNTEMVIFNTYSSTSRQLRWRAYIPTECIMFSDTYRNIIERILEALKAKGFTTDGANGTRKHGFDLTKMNAYDLMYLPCQAAEPDGTFWYDFRGPDRRPLDPTKWVNFDSKPDFVQSFVRNSSSRQGRAPFQGVGQNKIDAEIGTWRLGDRPENRERAWTKFYFALVEMHVPSAEVTEIMTAEANLCQPSSLCKDRLTQLERLQRQ